MRRYRENSLSLVPRRARPSSNRGSMKNDDAALVKEMKSGQRGSRGLENGTIDGDEAVYCLRSRSRTKKRGLIRCGSKITVGRFEK